MTPSPRKAKRAVPTARMQVAPPDGRRGQSARRRQTTGELRALQRLTLATIMHPLSRSGRTPSTFNDGKPMKQVVAGFIKPNDRLTSLERIEIYNRQYWFRLMDCLYDDYPGLRAILGEAKFEKLRIAYLNRHPSRSFTLRNLGSRLVQFLQEEPRYIQPCAKMCLDMARFEWAQVVAFDDRANPPLKVEDFAGASPEQLRLGLQPYLTLLELNYPLDDFVIAVKRKDQSMRSEASNAIEEQTKVSRSRKVPLPRPAKVFLAVHRFNNAVFFKRLDEAAYRILCGLREGGSVVEACEAVVTEEDSAGDWPVRIKGWFSTWAELGWLCRREPAEGASRRGRP